MELMARCERCGALVGPCDARKTAGGTRVRFWAAATTCTVDADGGMALDLGGATVLCPDCMERLKAWLAEEPEGPQETDGIADNDSVGKLAADMAKIAIRTMASGEDGAGTAACHYFGHSGVPCVDASGVPCRAYTIVGKTCAQFALDDVRRRCESLGIDLEEDADAGK